MKLLKYITIGFLDILWIVLTMLYQFVGFISDKVHNLVTKLEDSL